MSNVTMGRTPTPKEVVISLMTGTVPERRDEIATMWARYNPDVIRHQKPDQVRYQNDGRVLVDRIQWLARH